MDGEYEGRFDARRFIKRRLRELLDGEIAENPRLDPGRLQVTFSLDECLTRYFALAEDEPPAEPRVPGLAPPLGAGGGPPENAEEMWIETDDPPLRGRLDRVRRGVIVDYKTGDPDASEHEAQLLFYAVLWWLRYGRPPERLEVRYPGDVRQIAVPGPDELAVAVDGLRAEIAAIDHALNGSPPPARPALETCRYCPVRQLCDEFWAFPSTDVLRRPTAQEAWEGATVFRDVRLTGLPPGWAPGQPFAGTAEAEGIGPVAVSLESRFCPGAREERPREGRLLQAQLRFRDGAWALRGSASTEAFWLT
jgi:hypothetical protein